MSVGALTALVTLAGVAIVYGLGTFALCRCRDPFLRGAGAMLVAVAGGVGVVFPAFVLFEPPHAGEALGLMLPAIAAAGAILLGRWTWRAVRMIALSLQLTGQWSRSGVPLDDRRWGMNATAIDAGFPLVGVGGIFRPRLFVDRHVLELCSAAELDAIGAHERAHVMRYDNLRRLLVTICSGASSAKAAAWRESAEYAADRRAATSPRAALDLATALIKVSRIRPNRPLDGVLVSTIQDAATLESRVHRLIAHEAGDRPPVASAGRAWAIVLLAAPAVPLLLQGVHQGIELLVRHLP